MAVKVKCGARRNRHFGWRADVMFMTCDTKQPRIARDGDVSAEKIFGFGTVVGDRHMGAGAIGICLRHHDSGMQDFQIANAVRMRLCGGRGK